MWCDVVLHRALRARHRNTWASVAHVLCSPDFPGTPERWDRSQLVREKKTKVKDDQGDKYIQLGVLYRGIYHVSWHGSPGTYQIMLGSRKYCGSCGFSKIIGLCYDDVAGAVHATIYGECHDIRHLTVYIYMTTRSREKSNNSDDQGKEYIYIYTYVYVYTYIYIYTHTYNVSRAR